MLIACRNCHKPVSEDAPKCPNCGGQPIVKWPLTFWRFIGGLLACYIGYQLTGSPMFWLIVPLAVLAGLIHYKSHLKAQRAILVAEHPEITNPELFIQEHQTS